MSKLTVSEDESSSKEKSCGTGSTTPPLSTPKSMTPTRFESKSLHMIKSPRNRKVVELNIEQEEMLYSVSNVIGWCKYVYRELVKDNDEHLNYRKWMKVISRYYIDILNVDRNNGIEKAKIYLDLINQTSSKLSRIPDDVTVMFKEAKNVTYPLLDINDIMNSVPLSMANDLINKAGMTEYISLVLRYHILSLTEGLFLSIDPDLYECLRRSTGLPILECYASPFNYNIQAHCSLFQEDKVFGCFTRFDKFVDKINYPCRLCVNPPFTPRAIEVCIDKLISYMNRYNGEFVALIPIMYNYPPLEKILYYGNTQHVMLLAKTYTLYSFFSGKDIVTPMQLYLLVNVGGSKKTSRLFLEEIQSRLQMKANAVLNTRAEVIAQRDSD